MSHLELLRMLKSLQTDALKRAATLRGLATIVARDASLDSMEGQTGLYTEIQDCEVVERNQVHALDHAIRRLEEKLRA